MSESNWMELECTIEKVLACRRIHNKSENRLEICIACENFIFYQKNSKTFFMLISTAWWLRSRTIVGRLNARPSVISLDINIILMFSPSYDQFGYIDAVSQNMLALLLQVPLTTIIPTEITRRHWWIWLQSAKQPGVDNVAHAINKRTVC